MARVIICFFLIVHNLQGAAQPEEDALYIFNITKKSSLYIRLREEKAPHIVLKPSNSHIEALTEEIFKLPANTCLKVLHKLTKDNRLRLRIWPDPFIPNPLKPEYEQHAFCGKMLPPGGNILMLGHPSEWKRSATIKLRANGYEVKRNKILKQQLTPHMEQLCVARTDSSDLSRFKEDLSAIVTSLYPATTHYHPPYFETVAEFTKPLQTADIMSAVFDTKT